MCERLLQFLLAEASSGVTEMLSFELMEALLYRVQLSLFTGRLESALAVLQVSRDLGYLPHAVHHKRNVRVGGTFFQSLKNQVPKKQTTNTAVYVSVQPCWGPRDRLSPVFQRAGLM